MTSCGRRVVALTVLCLLGTGGSGRAQERRPGPYIGIELGATAARALSAPLRGNSQPTRCDTLLYTEGVPTGTDCTPTSVREIYASDFDLGGGFVAGVAGGYAWRRVRVEAEYLNHYQGSSSSLIYAVEDLVTSGKTREWNESALPFARVSDVRAHQFFANVYFDMANGSRWTPYVGAGLGAARTSLGYGNRYVRKTLAQGFFPAGGVDPAGGASVPDWQRNAAGTVSAVETEISKTHLGGQVLGGVDYDLTERVSAGVKVRWTWFGSIEDEFVWDLVRSHESVLADGVTPYTLGLELDGFQHVGATIGFKYRF